MLMSRHLACNYNGNNCSKHPCNFFMTLKTDYRQTETFMEAVTTKLPFQLKGKFGNRTTVYLQPFIDEFRPTLSEAIIAIGLSQTDDNAAIFSLTLDKHLSSENWVLGWLKGNAWNGVIERKVMFIEETYAEEVKVIFPEFYIKAESKGGKWYYKVLHEKEEFVFWAVSIPSHNVTIPDENFLMLQKAFMMEELAEEFDMKYEELQLFAEPVL
jgi:hypothetical protein